MPDMPEIDGVEHVIEYFWDCGPVFVSGGAASLLPHSEIDAWQRNTGYELGAWEVKTLRYLSAEYLSWSEKGKSATCPSPTAPIVTAEQRANVATRLRGAFRAMMGKGDKS